MHSAGLAPVILKLLKAKQPITIFAPTDEAFGNFTLPTFCGDQNGTITNATLKTTLLLHVVLGVFPNSALVDLDFGTQVQTILICTLVQFSLGQRLAL